jgi:hypothetical protein
MSGQTRDTRVAPLHRSPSTPVVWKNSGAPSWTGSVHISREILEESASEYPFRDIGAA